MVRHPSAMTRAGSTDSAGDGWSCIPSCPPSWSPILPTNGLDPSARPTTSLASTWRDPDAAAIPTQAQLEHIKKRRERCENIKGFLAML